MELFLNVSCLVGFNCGVLFCAVILYVLEFYRVRRSKKDKP